MMRYKGTVYMGIQKYRHIALEINKIIDVTENTDLSRKYSLN